MACAPPSLALHPITTHAFCPSHPWFSFAKATASTVVRGVKDMQGGSDEEHSGHLLPPLLPSHLDDRYRVVISTQPLYSAPLSSAVWAMRVKVEPWQYELIGIPNSSCCGASYPLNINASHCFITPRTCKVGCIEDVSVTGAQWPSFLEVSMK